MEVQLHASTKLAPVLSTVQADVGVSRSRLEAEVLY